MGDMHGFAPFDFLVDDLVPGERERFATHLSCTVRSALSFYVSSKVAGNAPHVVKHDGNEPTECDCMWFIYKVQPYLENNEVPPRVCDHFKRALLVLYRREVRERFEQQEAQRVEAEERRSNAPLNDTHKTFHFYR